MAPNPGEDIASSTWPWGVHTQTQHAGDRERWTGRACKDVERAACGGVKGPSSVCLLWRGSSRSSFPWKGTRVAAEKEKREILLLVPLGWHEHLNGHDNVRPLVRGETTMGAEGGHQHERSTTRENENENDHTDEQKNKHPSQQYPPTTHTHTHTRGSTEQFAIPAPAPDPDGEAWIGAGGSMLQGGHVQRRKDKVRRWQKKKRMAMLCVTAGLQLRIRARCRRPGPRGGAGMRPVGAAAGRGHIGRQRRGGGAGRCRRRRSARAVRDGADGALGADPAGETPRRTAHRVAEHGGGCWLWWLWCACRVRGRGRQPACWGGPAEEGALWALWASLRAPPPPPAGPGA